MCALPAEPKNDALPNNEGEKEPSFLEIKNKNKIPLWLAPCHLVAALFQCMQSLFLFAFSSQVDLKWFVYSNLPSSDVKDLEDDEYLKPYSHELGSYPITWYAGLFILLSGVDHILSILPPFRQHYEYNVERHQSPMRWVEFGLSAPLMRVHIAQVAGVTDVHTLFLIFFLAHTAIYFPSIHEKMNAKARADGYKQNWYVTTLSPRLSANFHLVFLILSARILTYLGSHSIAVALVIWLAGV